MKHSIWLMLDSRSTGGIESHVGQLAKALNSRGYDVWVVFWKLYENEHPLRSELQQAGIKTLVLNGSSWRYLRALRRGTPSIIHTHGYKAGLVARMFAWATKAAVVSSFHAGETPVGMVRLYDWLDRQSARWCKVRVAVSRQIADKIPSKTYVIENFVQTVAGCSDYEVLGRQVALVGRLSREKAPERVLSIARTLSHISFHIYGDGPLRQKLEQQAPDNVHFHGEVQSMQHHWRHIGLLLLPSRAEGLPMVALEAMANGCSVLATPVGALPELLQGVAGCRLLPGDEPECWYQAIEQWQQLDASERLRNRYQAIGRIEQQYSTNAVVPQFESLYQKALYQKALYQTM